MQAACYLNRKCCFENVATNFEETTSEHVPMIDTKSLLVYDVCDK
jgi:hypothetical protein